MVLLTPMSQSEFELFLDHDIHQYAVTMVEAGYWPEAGSLDRSRAEHDSLLPHGLATKDHHLYTIRDPASGTAVGVLWLKVDLESARPSGFIYDIEINEVQRGKGYARQAMLLLEEESRRLGLKQLSLHVAARNEKARSLYDRLGYTVAGLNMLKDL